MTWHIRVPWSLEKPEQGLGEQVLLPQTPEERQMAALEPKPWKWNAWKHIPFNSRGNLPKPPTKLQSYLQTNSKAINKKSGTRKWSLPAKAMISKTGWKTTQNLIMGKLKWNLILCRMQFLLEIHSCSRALKVMEYCRLEGTSEIQPVTAQSRVGRLPSWIQFPSEIIVFKSPTQSCSQHFQRQFYKLFPQLSWNCSYVKGLGRIFL